MSVTPDLNDYVREFDHRLGGMPTLRFPEGWRTSRSWLRPQNEYCVHGSVNPVQTDVLIGNGDRHRVTLAIHEGRLRAECDCDGWKYRQWCAHVAYLWWQWVNGELWVVDLDTGRAHQTPPWWLTVEDEELVGGDGV